MSASRPMPFAGAAQAVCRAVRDGLLQDKRIGALAIGPGSAARIVHALSAAIGSGRPLVLDADALVLLAGGPARLRG